MLQNIVDEGKITRNASGKIINWHKKHFNGILNWLKMSVVVFFSKINCSRK